MDRITIPEKVIIDGTSCLAYMLDSKVGSCDGCLGRNDKSICACIQIAGAEAMEPHAFTGVVPQSSSCACPASSSACSLT